MKHGLLISAFTIVSHLILAQAYIEISGPTIITVGDNPTYYAYYHDGMGGGAQLPPFGDAYWSVGNGDVVLGQFAEASISWTLAGPGYVSYQLVTWEDTYYGYIGVTIAPPAPTGSATVNYVCSTATLTRTASPPAQYDWYWQTSSTNESTSLGNTSQINVSTPGSYYLRARDKSSLVWSLTSTLVATVSWQALVGGTIGGTESICYNTTPSGLTNVSGASGSQTPYSYQWQSYSDGSWSNISGATATSYNPAALTATRIYRRAVTACSVTAYSNEITITVYGDLNPGSINSNQTVCYGADVPAFTSSAPASAGNGSYSYQWQSRPPAGSWSNISGATGATYDHGTLTATTEFQRVVTSCGQTKYSNGITVTVQPDLIPGTVASNQTICYSADVAAFTSSAAATGGNGSYSYQWQSRIPPGSWSNIPGATAATYDHSTLTATTEFQRVVTSCGQTKYSNVITVTVYPDLNAGTVATNQTICYNADVAAFTSSAAATGGNGSYSYQWQSRPPAGSWTNISGATATTYDHSTLTTTTEFQRVVTSCGQTKYSNVIIVTVNPDLNAGTVATNQTICYNTDVAAFTSSAAATGGNGSYSYQWQSRPPAGSWTNISGATAVTYNHGNLTATTEFQRVVTSCGQTKNSNVITVTVNPDLTAGTVATNQTICYNANVAAFTSSAVATGGNGSYSYQWQSRPPAGSWTNISGATATTYDHNTLTATTEFQRAVTSCGQTKYSNVITVTVYPDLNAGTIASNQTICFNTDVAAFTSSAAASGGNGTYSYQWQSRPPAGSWTNISGATAVTYNHGNLTATTEFQRVVTSCGQTKNSNIITVTVNSSSVGGTISGVEAFGTASGTLLLTGHTGNVLKWQRKIGAGAWTDLSNTTTSQAYSNITQTTYYRAQVQSGVCAAVFSSEANVIIYSIPSASLTGPSTIPYSGTTSVTTGSYYSYQWYKDGASISGATTQSLIVSAPGLYNVRVWGSSTSPFYNTNTVQIIESVASQNLNYIRSVKILKSGVGDNTSLHALSKSDFSQSITYFDGLGRSTQSVTNQGSPGQKDIVQLIEYDAFGREVKKILPYASTESNGMYKVNATPLQSQFYVNTPNVASDPHPFAVSVVEPSPLNRVLKQGAEGSDWQPNSDPYSLVDKTVKKKYEYNGPDEVLLWSYNSNTQQMSAKTSAGVLQYYPANQLLANKTYDESNNLVIEYVNKLGRVILKRVQATASQTPVNNTNYASTYYIYDDEGNLVVVLPPEASKEYAVN